MSEQNERSIEEWRRQAAKELRELPRQSRAEEIRRAKAAFPGAKLLSEIADTIKTVDARQKFVDDIQWEIDSSPQGIISGALSLTQNESLQFEFVKRAVAGLFQKMQVERGYCAVFNSPAVWVEELRDSRRLILDLNYQWETPVRHTFGEVLRNTHAKLRHETDDDPELPPTFTEYEVTQPQAVAELDKLILYCKKRIEVSGKDNASQAAPPDPTHTDSMPVNKPNGPAIPNVFRWNGKEIPVSPIPFKLINFLWTRANRTAMVDDVAEEVWGNGPSQTAMEAAKQRANRAITDSGCPLAISAKNGQLTLG